MFANRNGLLATMHQKERVIAPILEQQLGLKITVPSDFDTDQFGTFTRDIDRVGDQVTTARRKAEAALNRFGGTLAIAGEGSFNPHPWLPYVAYNREIVLLVDQQHELEVIGEVVSTQTNFKHQSITSYSEALDFATKVGFPEHGLVVMPTANPQGLTAMIKGITQESDLQVAVEQCLTHSTTGQIHIETDMRALYNPTRMQVIAEATQALVNKINHRCPQCSWPNFAIAYRKRGLPCELCYAPTDLIRSVIHQCKQCGFEQETLFPDGRDTADPGQCPYCNP